MTKTYLIFSLLIIGFTLNVFAAPTTLKNFCSRGNVQEKLKESSNRISFNNKGGLFNGGVCWWHSRLLRNASYLVYFSPEKEKPHHETKVQLIRFPDPKAPKGIRVPAPGSVRYILNKIKEGKEVVEIPGFSDLNSFSRFYEPEIQDLLNDWQLEDGVVNQSWIVGLKGDSEVEPEELQKRMNELYQRISDGEVVYQKLQLPGIVAHAWLVMGMIKHSDGYTLKVIDSNYNSIQTHEYRYGDTSLRYSYFGNFVPYTDNTREERRLREAREKFCRR
jgi:hypothetical protein